MKRSTKRYSALKLLMLVSGLMLALHSCKSGGKEESDGEDAKVDAQTPVTITTIDQGNMADYIDLNAVSTFLQRSYVKSNANGYVEKVYIQPGQYVTKGELLFTVKTKEAKSIGSTIN